MVEFSLDILCSASGMQSCVFVCNGDDAAHLIDIWDVKLSKVTTLLYEIFCLKELNSDVFLFCYHRALEDSTLQWS